MEKILIIRHGAFGDLVQCDGALRDIRAHHPDAEITMLTGPAFRKLMSRCPHIDHLMFDARAPYWQFSVIWRLFRELRAAGFDRVYDLQKSDRTQLYRRLILPQVPWFGHKPAKPDRTALIGFANLLESAGVSRHHTFSPDVSWMAESVDALLAEAGVRKPYVALIPGCSAKHPQKRWPFYAELARGLLDAGLDVVTAPGPDELDLARSIPGHVLLGPNGWLNWFELAGVLKSAAFVVGNDTGPSHVASCMNVSGLALFGAHTSAERTGIRKAHFNPIEVADLAQLPADRVLREVLARMGSTS